MQSDIISWSVWEAVDQMTSDSLRLPNDLTNVSRQSMEEDVDEMTSYFPRLLWLLRDVSLQHLVDEQGRQLTSRYAHSVHPVLFCVESTCPLLRRRSRLGWFSLREVMP